MAPRNVGRVRQRGRRWHDRWQDPTGREHSATRDTERLARRWLRDEIAAYRDPDAGATDPANKPTTTPTTTETVPTFAEWAGTWQTEATAHLRASSKARAASTVRARLNPTFGDRPIDTITTADVRRWMTGLLGEGLAPGTVLRDLRVLGACMQVAAEDGIIPSNPARGIKPAKVERHEQRYLTPAEVAQLADAIDPAYRGLIYLGAYGGLRIGEMLGLTVGNVNVLRGNVSVSQQVVEIAGVQHIGPPKSRAGIRTVPLPPFVIAELGPHLTDKLPEAWVFTAPRGGQVRRTLWAARFFRPAVEKAGLAPLRVHDLRHTAVALWIAAGASPLEVTKRAGHSSSAFVLDRYGHLYEDGYERTTNALDEIARAAAAHHGDTASRA